MVGHDVLEPLEPAQRHLRQHLALAGIGSPMITSKALRRSLATISSRSSPTA
jgi:hypothetical protein